MSIRKYLVKELVEVAIKSVGDEEEPIRDIRYVEFYDDDESDLTVTELLIPDQTDPVTKYSSFEELYIDMVADLLLCYEAENFRDVLIRITYPSMNEDVMKFTLDLSKIYTKEDLTIEEETKLLKSSIRKAIRSNKFERVEIWK